MNQFKYLPAQTQTSVALAVLDTLQKKCLCEYNEAYANLFVSGAIGWGVSKGPRALCLAQGMLDPMTANNAQSWINKIKANQIDQAEAIRAIVQILATN